MLFGEMDPTAVFTFMMGTDATDMVMQMTTKQGLKHFWSARTEVIMKELEQLIYRKVMEGHDAKQLSTACLALSHVPKAKALWTNQGLRMC